MSAWWIPWAAAVVGVFWLQVRRAVQADRRIVRALLETETGINPADQDECELIWSMPAYDPDGTAGFDRLRAVIRDEQQNGDA
ncbi:hypothetical protein ACH40F_08260 [Streptomyces sp. NPDC020794]|uniref:hypothetical protein n=1 Tax=unclassified Streptomyces TaxID=2593676 RepID=UPI0036E37C6E